MTAPAAGTRAVRRIALACASVLQVLLLACDSRGGMQGTAVDPPKEMPAFSFVRHDGSAFSTAAIDDRPMVLFFGYTHCPDVCPTTLADWKRAKTALGTSASRVRWVFVSIDPERDTPAIAQQYAAQFDSAFVGVSGEVAMIERMQAAFGASAYRDGGVLPPPDSSAHAGHVMTSDNSGAVARAAYLVTHSNHTFLLDDRGRLVALYSFGTPKGALLADLERLL